MPDQAPVIDVGVQFPAVPGVVVLRKTFGAAERRYVAADEVERLADAIERDRREPDKVLCHLQTLRRAAR